MAGVPLLGSWTSFQPGFRLLDGGQVYALANQVAGSTYGITAKASGTQADATLLPTGQNTVTVVGTTSDSVGLPVSQQGMTALVVNQSANTMQVYGATYNAATATSDVIIPHNSTSPAGATTGVAQATAVGALYVCLTTGTWKQLLFS